MPSKDRLKTALAVLGTLIGLAGVTITLITFVRDRPRLEVHVESVGLPQVAAEDVRGHLRRIEAETGAVTGSLISDLLREAEDIDDWTNVELVRSYSETVQEKAREFDRGRSWEPEDIRVEGTSIIWPDTSSLDVTKPSGAASLPEELVEAMRTNSLTPALLLEVQRRAHKMHGGVTDPEARELAATAAEKLRELRIALDEVVTEDQKRLVAKVTVRNRSALPNYIVSDGAITVAPSSGEPRTIDLAVIEDGLIDRYSVRSLTLESRALASLDENDRKLIADALGSPDGYACAIQLTDLHGEYWPGLGRLRWRSRAPDHAEFHRRGLDLLAEAKL